jgi:transcriptional regulator with XRE-family HTH domain
LLCVDEARVRLELAAVIGVLVTARRGRGGLSQERLARLLGVSANSVSAWETEWGPDGPTLVHLLAWARLVGFRMVIVDEHGDWIHVPLVRQAGEERDAFEMRRLLVTLRGIREGGRPRRTQAEVGRRAGLSRSSVRHWECLVGRPRTVGFIRWVLALGCRVELRPFR